MHRHTGPFQRIHTSLEAERGRVHFPASVEIFFTDSLGKQARASAEKTLTDASDVWSLLENDMSDLQAQSAIIHTTSQFLPSEITSRETELEVS